MRRALLALLLYCCQSESQQAITKVPGEPANLGTLKTKLTQYHACADPDCYTPQLEHQTELAIRLLKKSVATTPDGQKDKLAMVLDIDETALSNWSIEAHDDYGYISSDWNWCVTLHCSPAIPSTLRLFHEASAAGVAVFFISGRPETQRNDTAANLKAAGYDSWQALALRPVDHPATQTVIDYKSGERAKIVSQGYRIILNVGDQLSDLEGQPVAEHSVKLPNPFYFIP